MNSTSVLGKRKEPSEPLFGRPPPGYVAGVGRGMVIGNVEGTQQTTNNNSNQ
jgi:hypothetical protein